MRFARHAPPPDAHLDITAMIDIVLLLIIFFTFTTQFGRSLDTPLDLPQGSTRNTSDASAARVISIDLTREGRTIVAGREVNEQWLLQMLLKDIRAAGGPEHLDVVVRADRSCRAAHLNALAANLSGAGIRRWKLATRGGES